MSKQEGGGSPCSTIMGYLVMITIIVLGISAAFIGYAVQSTWTESHTTGLMVGGFSLGGAACIPASLVFAVLLALFIRKEIRAATGSDQAHIQQPTYSPQLGHYAPYGALPDYDEEPPIEGSFEIADSLYDE